MPDECDSLGNDEYFEHDLLAEEPFDDDDDVFEVLGEAHQVAEVGYPEGVDGNAELNEGDLCRGASARECGLRTLLTCGSLRCQVCRTLQSKFRLPSINRSQVITHTSYILMLPKSN